MTTDKVTRTEPTPLEVMAKLAATWAPDSMGNPTTTENQLELFDENMTILEPISLPHGGRHHGVTAYRELQERMRALWEQRIEATDYWQCGEDRVALRIVIAWTARTTGRRVVLPMIDLMRFRHGKIVEVEVFLQDTKALLDTLD
jgi:ketosteroid isomerase-like protein